MPNLALLCAAALMPAAAAQSATPGAGAAAWFRVGQIDALPARATLVATPLPRTPGIQAMRQPRVAGRVALLAPVLVPGQGPVLAPQGFNTPGCADANSHAECRLPQGVGADWQLASAQVIDAVSGAALVPGLTLNPTRSPYKLDEVWTYLASTATNRSGEWLAAAPPVSSGGAMPGSSGSSVFLSPTSLFNLILTGDYNTVAVDLTSASEASYVSGLTLSGYNTLQLLAAPGGILQLHNVTLAAGPPAHQNSMVLSSARNGLILVLGGSTDGSGITKVATVTSVSVLQSGAADAVLLGFNGTTGTVTAVLQSGSGVKTLQFDNYTNDMRVITRQTGSAAQTAAGIVIKAAPNSSFVLAQQ